MGIKAAGDGAPSRIVTGYAAVFNTLDHHNDIIVPGAFDRTIEERFSRFLIKTKHDHWEFCGIPVTMRPDAYGLYTENSIDETPLGDEVLAKVRNKTLAHMSFSYRVMAFEQKTDESPRMLLELAVGEVSFVYEPANDNAIVIAAKNLRRAAERAAERCRGGARIPGLVPASWRGAVDELAHAYKSLSAVASAIDGRAPQPVSERLLEIAARVPEVTEAQVPPESPDEVAALLREAKSLEAELVRALYA